MRRVILILTAALVTAAMLVINALPAAAQVEEEGLVFGGNPLALVVETCHQQAQAPEEHEACTFLETILL